MVSRAPDEPGPLARAVGYATAGRDALAGREEDEAILAYERALPLAEAAVAAGDGPHEDLIRFLAYVHDVLGGLMLGRSRLDRAERHYTAALELSAEWDPGGADVVKFTSNLGSVARHRGDLVAALGRYRAAAELAERMDPVPDALATCLSNSGTILLALGDPAGALALFRRALEIDERVDPADAATDLSLIGSVLIETGDLEGARDHHQRALVVHRALDPWSADTARDLLNLGYCHRLAGDLEEALRHYYAALDIDRARYPLSLETATDLNNISAVYRHRGNTDRARSYLEQALEISRATAPRSQRTAVQLTNLGSLHAEAGRYPEAREMLTEALDIDLEVAPRSLETARDLNNLANVAIELTDLELAKDYCQRALEIYRAAAPDSASVAVVYTTLSAVAHARHDREGALELTRAALEIDRRQLPDSEPVITDLVNLGLLHAEGGELDQAVACYGEAVDIAESLRRRAGTAEVREERFALLQSPYQGLVRVLRRRGGPGDDERAFDVAEWARGRALADLLARHALDVGPGDDRQRSLLAEEKRLMGELAAIARRLAGDQAVPAARDADLGRRHAAGEELERLRMRIRAEFPAYAGLRDPRPLGLADAQAMLPDDGLLLCYHVGDLGGAVWAFRGRTWRAAELTAGRAVLAHGIDAALASCQAGEPETAETTAAWHDLSRLLLGQVPADWLTSAARVVIIGDGPLLYLPFELLPYTGRPLADLLIVSYAPSVTVLGELTERADRARESPAGQSFLGIGFSDPDPHGDLPPLPGTREVSEIAADYGAGARVVTGPEATKDRVFREAAGYRVLHFATHGILDDLDPLYSGLQVAKPENGTEILHVYEMFALPLSGAVVICSACQTARGLIRAGEGLVGMSRALFYAGAVWLVLSLWPVPDAPTRRLMRAFHRRLRTRPDPAWALSLAKQDVRASHPGVYRHPYTWAGFVVLGPERGVKPSPTIDRPAQVPGVVRDRSSLT
jgi:tetratricopeptide (TPR) repeat protein